MTRMTAHVVKHLGGADLVGQIRGPMEMASAVRQGLPYASLEHMHRALHLTRKDLAQVMHVQLRTLDRRKKDGRLKPVESDRLFRIARIFTWAVEVLESEQRARSWLESPNRALGGRIPLQLLDTEAGAHEVEEILNRIEYGVFS